MTFSLIYTSVRSQLIAPVIDDWISKAQTPEDIEIILAVDGNDIQSQAAAKTLEAALPGRLSQNRLLGDKRPTFQWVCQESAPFNCVKGWNLAASKATGKVLIQLTDDMVPPPQWDLKLKTLNPPDWMDRETVVHVEDGYVHDIMVMAIITRARYERFGYFFYPDYESLFSDTELTETAYCDGVVLVAKHLLFEHRHPDCQKRARDAVDLVHASKERWRRGETLFNHRKAKGFPIDVGPKATSESKNAGPVPMRFCAYIQATRDDFCLYEVCERLIEEGVCDFFFSVPDEYWAGRPTPPEHIEQVRDIARRVRQLDVHVEVMVHKVKTYRFAGDTRLRVETRVRNDALAYIRKKGWEHVLIVDGDELWKRGALSILKQVLERWHPTAINCRMIPVIGLPGYPVDGATDVAVVYINSSTPFQECRTPIGEQFRIVMPLVIHFTGTRRTMQEIIQKHEDSGHYDDPDYDFKEFIENVLPKVRPGYVHTYPNGMKGLHFYKRYQIWPGVRNWMDAEVAEIPESLWGYLAINRPVSVASSQEHSAGDKVLLLDGSMGLVIGKTEHGFTGTVCPPARS
jgi:hypothetical protein